MFECKVIRSSDDRFPVGFSLGLFQSLADADDFHDIWMDSNDYPSVDVEFVRFLEW